MARRPSALEFFFNAALVLTALPSVADTAVIQTGSQDTVIYGDKNRVIQVLNQGSSVHTPGGSGGGDVGVIQDSAQGVMLVGDKNRVKQVVLQANQLEHSASRGQGFSKDKDKDKGKDKHADAKH